MFANVSTLSILIFYASTCSTLQPLQFEIEVYKIDAIVDDDDEGAALKRLSGSEQLHGAVHRLLP